MTNNRTILCQIGNGILIAAKILLTVIVAATAFTSFLGVMWAPQAIDAIWDADNEDD